jgi:hypothetical protein
MVDSASPQQLIKMLFDGLLASINAARGAIERGDINEKVRHIGKAVRILQEGSLGALDRSKGQKWRRTWPRCTTTALHKSHWPMPAMMPALLDAALVRLLPSRMK